MMVCARAREGFYQTCTDGPPLPTHAVSGGALVLLHRALRDALSPTMSHSRSWSEIRTCGTCGHFFQKPTPKSLTYPPEWIAGGPGHPLATNSEICRHSTPCLRLAFA